ncbi:hypothetical protein EG339_12925 [Chryseobacterium bernardetii]|uniref:Uncharacterized protein n=1 Tax=Chryseobacterium bernardetii TaxID=1241978 RepID=A0A3G6TFG0_9FLAO|nr:hypothetical protein [Chryseobacterium bernardetii]AZB25416.1 hypothetical protein EG339_12925 [Chryseobacterium bernardetii]
MIQYLFTILFIFTVFYTNACAQASKSYSITHIVNKTIDNGEYVDDKRIDKNDKITTSHLIYLLSPKKRQCRFLQIYGLGGIRKEGAGFIYPDKKRKYPFVNF